MYTNWPAAFAVVWDRVFVLRVQISHGNDASRTHAMRRHGAVAACRGRCVATVVAAAAGDG